MLTSLPVPSSVKSRPSRVHFPALDGIRGLAVLAVLEFHLFPATAYSPWTRTLKSLQECGANGVDLFFVLSGFLITGILYDTVHEAHFFRAFYARRMLRIFPLYYGVLAAFALGTLLFRQRYHGQLLSMALYLQNTHLLAPSIFFYRAPSTLPLVHFWSLAVEEQFYFVWPLVVFTLRSRALLLSTCLALVILCPVLRALCWKGGMSFYDVHMNTFLRADSLLAGGALALLLRGPQAEFTLQSGQWLLLGGCLLGFVLFCTQGVLPTRSFEAAMSRSLRYTGANLVSSGLILLALRNGIIGSFCKLPFLRFMGRYSYGLYVFHFILFSYLQTGIRHLIAIYVTGGKLAGVLLTGLLVAALATLAAVLSFHTYETFFLRLKHRFPYKPVAGR